MGYVVFVWVCLSDLGFSRFLLSIMICWLCPVFGFCFTSVFGEMLGLWFIDGFDRCRLLLHEFLFRTSKSCDRSRRWRALSSQRV